MVPGPKRQRKINRVYFEWDPAKARGNLRSHRVSFEEAATVFGDPLALTYPDPDHSVSEQRFITAGSSSANRVIIVAHTDRDDNIRIISARKATPRERKRYESVHGARKTVKGRTLSANCAQSTI